MIFTQLTVAVDKCVVLLYVLRILPISFTLFFIALLQRSVFEKPKSVRTPEPAVLLR